MVEFIGFIISLFALFYLFVKQNFPSQAKGQQPQSRRQPPPIHEEEEEMNDPFQEFLKSMEKEAAAREGIELRPPPSPPKKERPKQAPIHPKEGYRLTSSLEERHLKSSLETRHMKLKFNRHEELPGRNLGVPLSHPGDGHEKPRAPRVQSVFKRLAKRNDLIIYQEIIGKPKSLRLEDYP